MAMAEAVVRANDAAKPPPQSPGQRPRRARVLVSLFTQVDLKRSAKSQALDL